MKEGFGIIQAWIKSGITLNKITSLSLCFLSCNWRNLRGVLRIEQNKVDNSMPGMKQDSTIAIIMKAKVLCDPILVMKYHLWSNNAHIYFSSPGVKTQTDNSSC